MSAAPSRIDGHPVKPGDVLHGRGGETYRIGKLIGEGGYSVVHEAVCEQTGLHYAVKTLQPRHTANDKTVIRMLREAKALRALRHPNLVAVHHIGVRE